LLSSLGLFYQFKIQNSLPSFHNAAAE